VVNQRGGHVQVRDIEAEEDVGLLARETLDLVVLVDVVELLGKVGHAGKVESSTRMGA
jgi:hypothetical protein